MRCFPTALGSGNAHGDGVPERPEYNVKRLLLVLLCLFPGLACAGTLYRCVGTGGQVSYLATPCAAGQRMDRSIEFAAVPDSAPMAASKRHNAASAGGRSMSKSQLGSTASRPRIDPCLQAKTKREQQLERLGLKRTFADVSRLDEPVRAACRW